VGLVGANGAGKTTLLHLAVGLQLPSEGRIRVLGHRPGDDSAQLARVGFLGQDAPTYGYLTVAEHLRVGRALNPRWDEDFARRRVARLGLNPSLRAGRLSGGQRCQLALTLAMGKHPDLLLLDEPVSSLDPLARREFLQDLMELVAEHGPTVVLSSHLLSDIERICDHLIVLASGHVRVDGAVDELLATHKLLTGPARDANKLPRDQQVVQTRTTGRQTTALVRTSGPILDPRWVVSDVGLEELVLAYMASPDSDARARNVPGLVAS
jgi:ABC-2 type transport system ATP-binding protein